MWLIFLACLLKKSLSRWKEKVNSYAKLTHSLLMQKLNQRNVVHIRKCCFIHQLMCIPQISWHISYRVVALVWWCLLGCAPSYLHELCHPVSGIVVFALWLDVGSWSYEPAPPLGRTGLVVGPMLGMGSNLSYAIASEWCACILYTP